MADESTQQLAHRAQNPFQMGEISANAQPHQGGGLVAVEQQRAIAEVQARMIIARANPRDPIGAVDRILNDCTRPSLATPGRAAISS
jgi:hypothetical protein